MPQLTCGRTAKDIQLTLILQIVLGLVLLVGLVTIIMSSKNWHWTQLTLVLFIFFAGIGYLFLGAEVLRMHQNLRKGLPGLEQRIASLEKQNHQLLHGASDQPGILELDHRLQIVTRERGRVWRGVMPAGQVDPQGRVAIEIPKPVPHGLEQDAIIYAFQAGPPNPVEPDSGAQYLGEFRVTEVREGGATLEPVLLIDNRTGQRLASSQGPWSLYETMPIDRHSLYASFPKEQLEQMLPPESAQEYLRHGTEATADDDEWHVVGVDAEGKRVGPENMDQAVNRLYDRTLRDYAYIFNELAAEKVVALAKQQAVSEDNTRLVKSLDGAVETGEFRQAQIDTLTQDLSGMKRDLTAIEKHRDAVLALLSHFTERIEGYRKANLQLSERYTERQLEQARYIDQLAPAP